MSGRGQSVAVAMSMEEAWPASRRKVAGEYLASQDQDRATLMRGATC
jgi:hypothetical protein